MPGLQGAVMQPLLNVSYKIFCQQDQFCVLLHVHQVQDCRIPFIGRDDTLKNWCRINIFAHILRYIATVLHPYFSAVLSFSRLSISISFIVKSKVDATFALYSKEGTAIKFIYTLPFPPLCITYSAVITLVFL